MGPTYWHTKKMWREFLKFCPSEIILEINRSERRITLKGDRHVYFKSADNPDSLRSEGLDVLWVDEGGQVSEEAWELALRPALMDRLGKGIFTGSPKGKNWYYRLWMRGQDPLQAVYESWSFSSYTNPYLNRKELDDFKADMTELAFLQEVMAEFVDDVGSVFRGIRACVSGGLEEPQTWKSYVAGCDLAKHSDFTVICILDHMGHLVFFDRFSRLDWVFQCKRIVEACRRYRAPLLLDSTGVGDPIFDLLWREGLDVEGYKFTNQSKKELIENLSIMIDNRQLSYPDIPVLLNEMSIFGYKMSPVGNVQYGAPKGYHDDCPTALGLACWKLRNKQNTGPAMYAVNTRR